MGDHYIPQYYLKGFASNTNNQVCVYEKGTNNKFLSGAINIGHENNYYSPEVEKYLANEIEGPANEVIGKIRDRKQIIEEDKITLSKYMIVMLKRVPQGKIRMKDMAPSVAQKLSLKYDGEINELINSNPDKADFFEKRRKEIQANLEKYSTNPPKDFWLTLIPPERTPRIVEAVSKMTWRFLTYDDKPVYLTSDNPVFYFEAIGIGRKHSEITFPIASNIALWATWTKNLAEGYYPTKSQVVKEINRRTVSIATRYIYHAAYEDWILPFINKGNYQLHSMV